MPFATPTAMPTPVYSKVYARGWWRRQTRLKKLLQPPPDPNARMYPRPARAVFAYELGDSPKCRPGDTDAAKTYEQRVIRLIEQGGWTRSERNRLYSIRDKWHKRAYKQDIRFMILGTRPGRASEADEDRMDQYQIDNRWQEE